eukprot:1337657-Amphidinium_carterae.1
MRSWVALELGQQCYLENSGAGSYNEPTQAWGTRGWALYIAGFYNFGRPVRFLFDRKLLNYTI